MAQDVASARSEARQTRAELETLLARTDPETGRPLVDLILDESQKGQVLDDQLPRDHMRHVLHEP